MAARQDQGLVFTLIAFVILFIIAFVAAYVGWKSYSDSQTQLASACRRTEARSRLGGEHDARPTRISCCERWIGVGEIDNLEDVEKSVKDDMNNYGGNLHAKSNSRIARSSSTWRKENQAISGREAAAKEELKGLKDRLLAVEAENAKKVAQFQAQMQAAEQDAAPSGISTRKIATGSRTPSSELQDNLAKQEAKYEEQLAGINTQLKDLTEKLTKSEVAKENLLAEVSKSAESFEVPDGRVSWVNQDGTVWINLGAADALRRQITFSVFDADAQDPAKTEPKGSLEVTRILGDHMAEARVTNDDPPAIRS